MIKYNIGLSKTSIKVTPALEGETIENKVRRILSGKEPIKDGAQIIHINRDEGVKPEYNVRTDKMEIALETKDAIKKHIIAKNDESIKLKNEAAKAADEHGTKPPENAA